VHVATQTCVVFSALCAAAGPTLHQWVQRWFYMSLSTVWIQACTYAVFMQRTSCLPLEVGTEVPSVQHLPVRHRSVP
jgi:hypothetical protein